jgi:pimeloyl-ACP methyl ester carboxylesterase
LTTFTPSHRGGSGTPLVLLHGFLDAWRTWEPVMPALERHHDVLALTLPGHAGGPPLDGAVTAELLADAVEQAMDAAGLQSAHVAGNSLGGFLALELAARGRARSVVALAPAGGWARGDESYRELFAVQLEVQQQARAAAAHVDAIAATPEGRRRALGLVVADASQIPAEVVAHQLLAAARCAAAPALVEAALKSGWTLDAERIECPVRVVWGTADKLLPWPQAAERYRQDWLPHADWVELDGVGHAPQLEAPLATAELIRGWTER